MLGLNSINEYLDLERAAEIIQKQLKINFNELDLLRLIFEDQLEVSINFLDEYYLEPIKKPIKNYKTETENDFNKIEHKVFSGTAILPMTASQEKLIKNLYAQKLNGSKIHFNPSPIVIKISEELYHLYPTNPDYHISKEPLFELPDTSLLCIKEKSLSSYISSKLECNAVNHNTTNSHLLIIGALLDIIKNINSININFCTQERLIHYIEEEFPHTRGLKYRTLSGVFAAANKKFKSEI